MNKPLKKTNRFLTSPRLGLIVGLLMMATGFIWGLLPELDFEGCISVFGGCSDDELGKLLSGTAFLCLGLLLFAVCLYKIFPSQKIVLQAESESDDSMKHEK